MGLRALQKLWPLGLMVVLAGCEAAANETLTLPPVEVTFRFEVNGNVLQDGQAYTATSMNTIDLTQALAERGGYRKNEVTRALVTGATLIRIQPVLTDLADLLTETRLMLSASGLNDTEVAARTGFPDESEAALAPRSGIDVTAFVQQPFFRAKLRLVPRNPNPQEQYVYEVRLTLQIQVEGV